MLQRFCSADMKIVRISLISVDLVHMIADGLAAVATYIVDQKSTSTRELSMKIGVSSALVW